MTEAPFTGEDVLASRKAIKPRMSREKFALQAGLTPTKLYNIEKGRPMTPEEVTALTPYVTPGIATTVASDAPPPPPPPTPSNDGGDPLPAGDAVDVVADNDTEDEAFDETEVVVGDTAEAPDPDPDIEKPVAVAAPELVVPEGTRAFTNSELRTFKRCRRKWWLAYYRRLGLPVQEFTGARSIGTRIHKALQAYYVPAGQTPQDPKEALEEVLAADLELMRATNPMQDQLDQFVKDADLCRAMIEGYVEYLAESGADQFIEVVAPETKILVNVDVPNAKYPIVALLGKLDVRVRRTSDGARLFEDHKTVGDLTTPQRTLHMDEQMMQYHLLELLDLLSSNAEAGERTDGGLYNMLRKVKRTARATPPFYDRVEVRHNEHTLRSFYIRVIGEILDIIDVELKLDAGADARQVAYPMPTRDCTWDCDFFHICTMFDDGSRVEDYIAENLVTIDPHQRYEADALTAESE